MKKQTMPTGFSGFAWGLAAFCLPILLWPMASLLSTAFVKNGVVEKMFIEPNEPGDPFKVSDADTMLKYIAPNYQVQESIAIFTKPGCPYCAKAKQLLHDKGLSFEEIVLGHDATIVSVRAVSGRATVPQVFIGGKHIGGSDDLEKYFA